MSPLPRSHRQLDRGRLLSSPIISAATVLRAIEACGRQIRVVRASMAGAGRCERHGDRCPPLRRRVESSSLSLRSNARSPPCRGGGGLSARQRDAASPSFDLYATCGPR